LLALGFTLPGYAMKRMGGGDVKLMAALGLATDAGDRGVADTDAVEVPAIFNQLSLRQLEVARLVGKGQTNYQIACELGITENTVKLYVSQVLRLAHMHNRTQLALALSPSSSGGRQRVTAH